MTDTPTTVALNLDTSVDNSWIYLDAEFLNSNDEIVHVAGQTISYYHGYEGGESWSEGSDDHQFLFRVQQPGTYRFRLTSEADRDTRVRVKIEEGIWLSRFPLFGLILTAFSSYYGGCNLSIADGNTFMKMTNRIVGGIVS